MNEECLRSSRALWNRSKLDIRSREVLAQLLDRGELHVWRELYVGAREDPELRRELVEVVMTVPLPLPRFWLAVLKGLGESVDLAAELPAYDAQGT